MDCLGTCFLRSQVQLSDQIDENEEEKGLFKHFNINETTQERLKARGIEYLFPVQSRSYKEIMSGKDCIVQARKLFPFNYS